MIKINPYKVLPHHLIIESADTLLYASGLYYQDRNNDESKRKQFYRKQNFQKLCLFIGCIQGFVFAFIPKQSKTIQLLFGDLGHLKGMNEFYSLCSFFAIATSLASIFVLNNINKKGIQLKSICVFQMMCYERVR